MRLRVGGYADVKVKIFIKRELKKDVNKVAKEK